MNTRIGCRGPASPDRQAPRPEIPGGQRPDARKILEFLRGPSMSCGVYVLPAVEKDRQRPDHQDEAYYVVSGAARIKVTLDREHEQDREIRPGDVIFVGANEEHQLVVLVGFAPAMTQ